MDKTNGNTNAPNLTFDGCVSTTLEACEIWGDKSHSPLHWSDEVEAEAMRGQEVLRIS